MTNIEIKNFGHTARNYNDLDDFNEYPEKPEENSAYPHLTQHKPLTVREFKARLNSGVLTNEDIIKAVYDALPDVNSNAFYRNGLVHLKYSPMESLLHGYLPDSPITAKFDEQKLLLRDIVRAVDECGKASEPDTPTIAEYAKALAKSSICYVDDKYDGKENN